MSDTAAAEDTALGGAELERKRKRPTIYCEHCSSFVPKSTYYRHWTDYFDEVTRTWTTIAPSPTATTQTTTHGDFESNGRFVWMIWRANNIKFYCNI